MVRNYGQTRSPPQSINRYRLGDRSEGLKTTPIGPVP